jgi:hypothetical protein
MSVEVVSLIVVTVFSETVVVSVPCVGMGDPVKHQVSNANKPTPVIVSINFFIVIEIRI